MLIKSYLVVMIKLVNFTNRIESKQNEVTKCHICPMICCLLLFILNRTKNMVRIKIINLKIGKKNR